MYCKWIQEDAAKSPQDLGHQHEKKFAYAIDIFHQQMPENQTYENQLVHEPKNQFKK